jgi:hypothetical protein
MSAAKIISTIAFKKLTLQNLFFFTIFTFIVALSLAIPRCVLAQGPPDRTVSEKPWGIHLVQDNSVAKNL